MDRRAFGGNFYGGSEHCLCSANSVIDFAMQVSKLAHN